MTTSGKRQLRHLNARQSGQDCAEREIMNTSTRHRRRCLLATACVALLVAVAAIAPSIARSYSFGGTLASARGPLLSGDAEQLSCLGATPGDVIEYELRGEIGSTVDDLGRGHATMNARAFFSLWASDPLNPGEPSGELLYTGSAPVHFSAFIEEWPEEGFVVTPFDSVKSKCGAQLPTLERKSA